jgi:hypothetical protein
MSSSTGYSAGRRPTAYAARVAARQRRQLIIVIVLVVILVGVLAWEIPHLHLFGGSKTASVTPTLTTPIPSPGSQKSLAGLRKKTPTDPFAAGIAGGGTAIRDVGPPPGSVDPFAAPAPSVSASPEVATPLPQQIVIGTPGNGRVATHGWIVILASIPTGEGRAAAANFAARAQQKGVGGVSILNSSNRRPLRGGYWVVYIGPYASLSSVTQSATSVHARGYSTAYVRELIVYK